MSFESNRAAALGRLVGGESAGLRGITSVCSAHPLVIEAALSRGKRDGTLVLIEATCNQVNQAGGYTGMTPRDFRTFVAGIADTVGLSMDRVILGGDHLGPNPWKTLPADEAMRHAEAMVAAYVNAGFSKIHLDCSMGCAGEPVALADDNVAVRAARLAAVAEQQAAASGVTPSYIIGTEVPPPGGATHAITTLDVTAAEAVAKTREAHRVAFADAGLDAAFERVIGLVVQPGVEFGNENVVAYVPKKAQELSATLTKMPGLVFEAHSTDYQTRAGLASLVADGFAILKVGPGLTFALREALYGLDAIAAVLVPDGRPGLMAEMEALMLEEPKHWRGHYHGETERLQRHFSYSDRIRYYWPHPRAAAAVARLTQRLAGRTIPETLISQHLARLYPAVAAGELHTDVHSICVAAIDLVLADYAAAVQG